MGKEYTKPITMSWQAYVDQQLVGTGSCTSGAILGHDGSTWATSAGFAVSAAEGQKLASQFANPGSAQADGSTSPELATCACALMTAPSMERRERWRLLREDQHGN